MAVYLGVDTSCYTTSIALVDDAGHILADLRMPLSPQAGQKGLRQSDAVFLHMKHLPTLCEQLFSEHSAASMSAIGVSLAPRPCQDSYMPVFQAGLSMARSIASALNLPLMQTTHQEGHLASAALGAGFVMDKPFLATHVSGGTTELLSVSPHAQGLDITLLGGTKDLHAGQVIDRIGVALGLPFPCGPALEALAQTAQHSPKMKVSAIGMHCNLSGIESQALQMLSQGVKADEVSASLFDALAQTLCMMLQEAICKTGMTTLLLAGGVMANQIIRQHLKNQLVTAQLFFAPASLCGDNAVGVAVMAHRLMGATSEGIDHYGSQHH